MAISTWADNLIAKTPNGWVEVYASVTIQVVYLACGILVEAFRPTYRSKTSKKMIADSLRNHLVATLLHMAYVVCAGGQAVLTRTYTRPYTLPSWREVVSDMVVAMLLRDIFFYAIHRFWHVPGVYAVVHSKHHEVLEPGEHHVWTISYMSVVDFVFLYGAPVLVVAKLMEMNLFTTAVFAFVSAVGEQLKLVYGDEAHDQHHADGSVNYGAYGLMDAILGTASGSGFTSNKNKSL